MNVTTILRRGAITLAIGSATLASHASDLKTLAGTYAIISVTTTTSAGEKQQPFGPQPIGMLMVAPDGRYITTLLKPDLPKVVANNRDRATPEETRAIVSGSISHMGRITAQGDSLVFQIDHSTFPNWNGTTQKRTFSINGDVLTIRTPTASTGGSGEIVWGRLK